MRGLHVVFAFVFVVLSIVTSCAQPQQPELEVTPATHTLVTRESEQLTVTRRFPGGWPVEQVTNLVTYTTSNRNVATVTNEGLVTAGEEPGIAVIRVFDAANDAVTSATFTVAAPRNLQLRAIVVTPNPATIVLGRTAQLNALGVYDDGSSQDITSTATWSSSNDAVVRIDASGLATGVAAGQATITAAGAGTTVKSSSAIQVQ